MSLSSLSLDVIRHGPVAWINEEADNEKDNDKQSNDGKGSDDDDDVSAAPYSLSVGKSRLTLVKTVIYLVGIVSGIFGCLGFLVMFIPWTFMSSRWFFFLLPILLLQITQPNWLAFMWSRFRRRRFSRVGAAARHRGVWWRFFLTASPFVYCAATAPHSVVIMFKYMGVEETALGNATGDTRPFIHFSRRITTTTSMMTPEDVDDPSSPSAPCTFALRNMEEDEDRWRNVVADVYDCVEDVALKTNPDKTIRPLELGNSYLTSPGAVENGTIRFD